MMISLLDLMAMPVPLQCACADPAVMRTTTSWRRCSTIPSPPALHWKYCYSLCSCLLLDNSAWETEGDCTYIYICIGFLLIFAPPCISPVMCLRALNDNNLTQLPQSIFSSNSQLELLWVEWIRLVFQTLIWIYVLFIESIHINVVTYITVFCILVSIYLWSMTRHAVHDKLYILVISDSHATSILQQ